jgi:Ca2+-binding RTX toxin-like protein
MPTESDDIITIRSFEEVWGLGGADEFRWSGGKARLHGGDTAERYDTDVYGDRSGGDRLFVLGSKDVRVRFTSTEDGHVQMAGAMLTFTGIERLYLGNGNDTINASGAPVVRYGLSIYADGGTDKITGSRGTDFIDPGAGNDRVKAGAGDDFVQASKGNDRVNGGAGDDNIRWGQGNFQEIVGNDRLSGGSGFDLINVWIKDGYNANGGGVEVNITKVSEGGEMTGTSFTDIGGARSTLRFKEFEMGWTHEGRDMVSAADAEVVGNGGINWNTRWGDDVLIGSRGNDILGGGPGSDVITGGRGDDRIYGDEDADVLKFRAGDGHDTVYGFVKGLDRLDLDGRHYEAQETNSGTRLEFANGDWILLNGVFDY